ncbi:uncharacterized protein LOC108093370 [Drosophila ficusphila]|uniref:uncharacterized protein LOC108093370 n=1 Tax=Drosophila ficusphila TaxID=30025 RepID=UPI001C88FA6C|nr:uncharacterized protein LOC108093370 [Drosophila ficusphila]
MELEKIEDGLQDSVNLLEPGNKTKSVGAVKIILMVLLLNFCLIVGTIPFYIYMTTINEVTKERFLDFILVGGSLISIPLLYSLGDLSKNRPNFYYI